MAEMNLYPEMNKKIVKMLESTGTPIDAYASCFIKHLRLENEKLKAEFDEFFDMANSICDRYKARAEAMERALKDGQCCIACASRPRCGQIQPCARFVFDEQRFTEGGEQG